MASDREVHRVTITSGQSLSGEVNLGGRRLVGIQMPAGWDAASITFAGFVRTDSANPPTETFGKVQDAGGAEVAITAPAADVYIAIAPTVSVVGLGRVKVRSGVAATPVNQTANRTLFLVTVPA